MQKQKDKLTTVTIKSPGRVNLLGEHVDYNGGIVLPVAIDRHVRLTARAINEPIIQLNAVDLNSTVSIPIRNLQKKCDENGAQLPTYALYPAGVAWALQQNDLDICGIDAVYTSNIPIGAGLSSSAAVELAFALAWKALVGWKLDRMDLARVCQQAENKYVGVNSGLMDQFACAFGEKDRALYLDTVSFEWKTLPLPQGVAIVIADSGVRHSLAGSEYNERRKDCEEAVKILQCYLPNIQNLRDVSINQLRSYEKHLGARQQKRARYVVEEIDRVFRAVDYLNTGDLRSFGYLMFECHAGLRDLYEVSCEELDILVGLASRQEGCYGSRLTGAGFGGCTVNLVKETHAESFISTVSHEFKKATGYNIDIYLCHASNGVHSVEREV